MSARSEQVEGAAWRGLCVATAVLGSLWMMGLVYMSGAPPAVSPVHGVDPWPAAPSTELGDRAGASGSGARALVADSGVVARAPALVRGRCVGLEGEPLAASVVALSGVHRLGGAAMAADAWHDPASAVTGADGVFELLFAPPPDFRFSLTLDAPGRARVQARWSQLAAGSTTDLGDVVLQPGASVHGWVHDTDGAPCAGAVVVWTSPDPLAGLRGGGSRTIQAVAARTGPDGGFAVTPRLPLGAWDVAVLGRRVLQPAGRFEIALAEVESRVTVAPAPPQVALRGEVVGGDGAPVARALVSREPGGQTAHAGAFGEFVLASDTRDAPDQPFALRVEAAGHDALETGAVYRFGDPPVRLVLPEAHGLELLVVRREDDVAVEDFVASLLPLPGSAPVLRSEDAAARGGRHHPGGRLRLERLRSGPYLLAVEPPVRSDRAPSPLLEVEIDATTPAAVVVRLPPRTARGVLVRDANGAPVAGARVELVATLAGAAPPPPLAAPALGAWRFDPARASAARQVASVATGTDGRCELHGAAGHDYAVMVRSAQHAPVVRHPVRLDVGAPLRVVLPRGAELSGVLGPPSVLAALRASIGLEPAGAVEPELARLLPAVQLVRSGVPHDTHPRRRPAACAPDGSFHLRAVPAGNWDLYVVDHVREEAAGFRARHRLARRGLLLREAASERVDLDLAAWLPARLTALVRLDGAAFHGRVRLVPVGEPPHASERLETGADGRFVRPLAPGPWRVELWHPITTSSGVFVRTGPPVSLAPGAALTATFDASVARAVLRLLEADGQPATGSSLHVSSDDGRQDIALVAPSDRDGRTVLVAGPGRYLLRLAPSGPPLAAVVLPSDAIGEVVVRLPAGR